LLGISHASRVAHGSSAAKCVGQWMNSIARDLRRLNSSRCGKTIVFYKNI
jgi:hypothetical protein